MNFGMNHAPSAGSITQPVDLLSRTLSRCLGWNLVIFKSFIISQQIGILTNLLDTQRHTAPTLVVSSSISFLGGAWCSSSLFDARVDFLFLLLAQVLGVMPESLEAVEYTLL